MTPPRRQAVTLALVLLGTTARAEPPTAFAPKDFVEYWAAGRAHSRGTDPYDAAAVLPLQRQAAGDPDLDRAVMLWTPPWTLPLYWPAAALPPRPAHLGWVVAQTLMVLLAAALLWRAYGRAGGWLGRAAVGLLTVGFAPLWWMVAFGQNTGFLALGLAGFCFYQGRGRPLTAGACAALTAVKPHDLALFGLVLVLDAGTRRGRPALLAGAGVLLGLGLLALVPDPGVYGQFAAALGRPAGGAHVPLSEWMVPTPSFRLAAWADERFGAPGRDLFWVQFVPLVVGSVAVVPYWWGRRRTWDWLVETPRLVFASVLVAPYGAWIFDLTVLLVPLVRAAGWVMRAGRPVPAAALATGAVLVSFATLHPALVRGLQDMIWFPPAVLGLYLLAGRFGRGPDRERRP